MRSNDVGLVLMVLGVGFVMGALTTVTVVTMIYNQRDEAEQLKAEERLRQVEQERDEAEARVSEHLDQLNRDRALMEQGGAEDEEEPVRRPARAARKPPVKVETEEERGGEDEFEIPED
jgi:F0F1-type ATP synthase membrane subunit b/b'